MTRRIHPVFIWLWAGAVGASMALTAMPLLKRHLQADPTSATFAPLAIGAQAMPAAEPDIAAILAFPAFGSPQSPEAVARAGQDGLPGLTLLGVTLATDASASKAIIAGGAALSMSYRIGAEILPGTVLRQVQRRHVLLDTGGQVHRLDFAGSGVAQSSSAPDRAAAGAVDLANLIPMAEIGQSPVTAAGPDPVDRLRIELHQDARGLLDRLGLRATKRGYVIGAAPAALLARAGLLAGDLVARVNGKPVGNIDTDQRSFDEVVASGQARVEVIRGEQTLTMTFPIP